MSIYTRPDSRVSQVRLSIPVNGSRVPLVRSLGAIDRVRAAPVASSLQSLAEGIPSGDWMRIKRLIEDCFLAAGHPVPVITRDVLPVLRLIVPFVEDYICRRKKAKLSASHKKLMERCLRDFARAHAALELAHFKGLHIQAWLDGLEGDLAAGSVRNKFSVLSAMFSCAVKLGLLSVNPCAGVEMPDGDGVVMKLPVSDEDFAKFSGFLTESGKGDWQTVSYLMRYAGLRLVDASRVEGVQVFFVDGACLLDVTPGKTEKAEVLPVFPPLSGYLKGLAGQVGPLAPSLAGLSSSCLSKRFSALCDEAGIDGQVETLANGRKHRRVSAHSWKHAFVTGLARLGIPEGLRMKMAAHVSEESHRGYDHTGALDLHRQVAKYFSATA